MNKQKFIGLGFISLGLLVFGFIGFEYYTKTVELKTPYQPKEMIKNNKIETKTALFAGGCFWCVEKDYEKLDGIIEVVSGYAGGETTNPTYQNHAGHREVVQVIYDPTVNTYRDLVDYFWRHVDPTDNGGSFYDRGHAYTSAVFYATEEEKLEAEASKKTVEEAGIFTDPIVTPILPVPTFYPAEEYHQDYYKKNPIRYQYYRNGSGRDRFIEKHWGDKE